MSPLAILLALYLKAELSELTIPLYLIFEERPSHFSCHIYTYHAQVSNFHTFANIYYPFFFIVAILLNVN